MTPSREDTPESELSLDPDRMLELASLVSRLTVERLRDLPEEAAWKGARRSDLDPRLAGPAPEAGTSCEEVVERVFRDVLPYAARVDHPRFFAFVPSSGTWPGVLADFMSAGHNVFQGTWLGSSGPSTLELVVVDWFREWIGYPEGAGGLFTSGGSAASLDALVAAREAAGAPERATVYMSDQSHTALVRAARIVGVRPENVRMIPSDDGYRIDLEALRRTVAEDRAEGKNPVAICANAGTTNTGAVDPIGDLADLCAELGIWLHVDAAYGGFAILTERGKAALAGLERADSIAMDAHKWLYQPFEAGCLMVRDVRGLERAFSVRPEYLQDADWGTENPNFGDRGLQLSRSFRALKVWMSIQTFGLGAFRRAVDRTLDLAERAEAFIRDSPVLELLQPASLGIVCFRVRPSEAADAEELEALNERVRTEIVNSGLAMMSSTRLRGTYALRLCILNHTTSWDDVRRTLEATERYA
ncbi:MAG: aminotransferase class I/II-fold pyridoxal phosphate-dependent enzyme [Gemmatimonadota bacterium]|nr:aminotransferase class I/II-fold pyridoxal phosphate-dependent enzyme [Gemmatimonadota bacterium]